ncbi:MAG: energy transducer TonB [Candidatus Acidiferrum sp.]
MQEVTRNVTEVEKSAKNRKKDKLACATLLALLGFSAVGLLPVRAQSIPTTRRPVKHLVTPAYPELAKKLNLTGTARIEVTISPDGTVKRTRVLGGHPVLATEAERAAEKSTFEPGPAETVEVIEFKF